jgi:sterol desaturase/sphingolipid hydroxylase (fatty acid hydroxylase superfamily)
MQHLVQEGFLEQLAAQTGGAFTLLFFAYLSLLCTWPLFLWMEKRWPAVPDTPRSNYWFNWQITLSNLFLAPVFAALVTLFTLSVTAWLGTPSLELSPVTITVGVPALDLVIQGAIIFLVACFLGDFAYYWWHRLQHTVPVLWELHKLHHSDEHLNTTTIYRSHFLEPAGQGLVRGLTIGLLFDISAQPATLLAVVAGGLLIAIWDYFIHANVRLPWLDRLLPLFSTPHFHWIHHSREARHRDKNFSIWLPMFDIAFGTYYRPGADEYPQTGLSNREQFTSVWQAQAAPFIAWSNWRRRRSPQW